MPVESTKRNRLDWFERLSQNTSRGFCFGSLTLTRYQAGLENQFIAAFRAVGCIRMHHSVSLASPYRASVVHLRRFPCGDFELREVFQCTVTLAAICQRPLPAHAAKDVIRSPAVWHQSDFPRCVWTTPVAVIVFHHVYLSSRLFLVRYHWLRIIDALSGLLFVFPFPRMREDE